MTDEEQIIIQGIDVSKCKFYRPGSFPTDCEINPVNAYCESPTSSNCYFKQLARKTQECESLKQDVELLQHHNQQLNSSITGCDHYRKALEEIEDIVQNHIINDFSNWNMGEISDDIVADYVVANCKQVLNIINKAKGR